MRLGIQNPVVETNGVGCRVEQVKVLERLGKPEALHGIRLGGVRRRDQVYSRVTPFGLGGRYYRFEHLPSLFLPDGVAGDAVHVPHGLDGFRPE